MLAKYPWYTSKYSYILFLWRKKLKKETKKLIGFWTHDDKITRMCLIKKREKYKEEKNREKGRKHNI